jgi:hypothetical protein
MEKLNITQGECKIEHQRRHHLSIAINGIEICFLPRFQDNVLDNAILISDTITAYNTTLILPSELLKQRNELLEALEKIKKEIESNNIANKQAMRGRNWDDELTIIETAIKNATNA